MGRLRNIIGKSLREARRLRAEEASRSIPGGKPDNASDDKADEPEGDKNL